MGSPREIQADPRRLMWGTFARSEGRRLIEDLSRQGNRPLTGGAQQSVS